MGGVAIHLLKKANKWKRDDEDDKKAFDELDEITDTQSDDEEVPTTTPALVDANTVEVDTESSSNVVIKAVKEAAGKVDQAASSVPLIATREEVSDPQPAAQTSTQAASEVVKLFEREDLAMDGTEAKIWGLCHPPAFTTQQKHCSDTCLGTYELPQSMYMEPIGGGNLIFPAHITLFYPKPRVPRVCMDGPNYTRILNETAAVRKLQVAQPGRVNQHVFY